MSPNPPAKPSDDRQIAAGARQIQAAILHRIRLDLDLLLRPELTSVEARASAALASEMLSHVIAALRDLPDGLDAHLAALSAADDAAARLLGSAPAGAAPAGIASELQDDTRLDAVSRNLAGRMSALIERRRRGGDPVFAAEVVAAAAQAVAAEGARVGEERRTGLAEMTDDHDPVSDVEVEVTADRLDRFFADRFDGPAAAKVARIARLAGGYSKDTFAIEIDRELAGSRELVLRRDLPFGPGENSVVEEYELLRAVANAGMAVARPFWCEADQSYAGRPFLLFPRLPGSAIPMDWPGASQTEKDDVCRQIASQLARLHQADPETLGAAAPDDRRSPQQVVRDYVRHWRTKWLRRRVHPSAILEVAYDWLEWNAPEGPSRVSVVHGDMSLANTLVHDGQVTAILDWEFWHLGDPIEDLGYFRWGSEPHVPWSKTIAAYREAGGEDYDPERAKFYEIWRSVRNATTISTAWYGFLTGKYPATKAAYQGVAFYRYCLIDLAQKLKEVQL